MRKTKIVCTIGPSCEDVATLEKMMRAGMNCARLNFSHGSHEEHKKRIDAINQARENTGCNVALILDTKGPEIRIKQFKDGIISLKENDTFTLCCYDIEGDETKVSVTYDNLYKEVSVGTTILVDDGLIALDVIKIDDKNIVTRVKNGGVLKNNKSMNIPSVHIELESLTQKDRDDIAFGVENDIDYIAASFVRSKADVIKIKELLNDLYATNVKIISKIENQEGVDNLSEILEVSDGIMVARGDLGVEIPAEKVPMIQKKIIHECNIAGKSAITATQMLESMTNAPRPTRAEVGDVANAMYDGSDAVMLSGETAAGKYPVESVETMARILETAEESLEENAHFKKGYKGDITITGTIGYAAVTAASRLQAKAIITPTASGNTSRMISKFHPDMIQIAVTTDKCVQRQLALVWGVIPLYTSHWTSLNDGIRCATNYALDNKIMEKSDTIVVTAGLPLGKSGSTNTLKIDKVEDFYER